MPRMFLLLAAIALLSGLAYWLWTPDKPRAALEAKYLRDPGDMIEIEGARLHVRASGPRTKPAVIMIHGFGSSLHTWEGWAHGLEDRFRVIRFDLPGSGLSEPDALGRYDDRRSFQVLSALMDHLGVRRASLIGNSIGGRIAWGFAAEQPDRVDKLVLVAPDGFASQGFSYGVAPKVPMTLEAMRYVLPRFLLKMNLVPAYGDPNSLTEGMVDRYHDLMLAPGVRAALIDRMRQTVLDSPEGILSRIKSPALLVWGEKDGAIPISNAADYQRLLPRSELAAFPGIGHLPQEEAPQATLPAVKAFLLR
jgi:pimeloyl-ACP methyl ester carboxylesterase